MIEEKPPLFELDERIFDCMAEDDIYKTFIDMKQMNIDSPPYSSFVIKLNFKLLNVIFKTDINPGVVPNKIEAAYIWILCSDGRNITECSLGIKCRGEKIDWIAEQPPKEVTKEIYNLSLRAYATLIVLLATKNADKVTRVNSERASSHRVREQAKNFSTTTTIRIGKITETMRGPSSGTGTKTRPHLRRGHVRNQRYGENWSETKQIFIAPMFVNADENWIAEQKTYKVVP